MRLDRGISDGGDETLSTFDKVVELGDSESAERASSSLEVVRHINKQCEIGIPLGIRQLLR